MSVEEPQEPQAEPQSQSERPSVPSNSSIKTMLANRDPVLLTVLGVSLFGLILICVFGVLLIRSTNGSESNGFFAGLFGDGGDDGVEATPTLPTLPTPEATAVAVVYEPVPLDSSQQVSLTLDAPVFLDINGQSVAITTAFIPANTVWNAGNVTSGNAAVWPYGNIVNYVFALPADAQYETVLNSLVQGDPIVVDTKNGASYEFIFTGSELVDESNSQIFAQNRPSVTLVWLGESETGQRLVVHGDYVVAEEELQAEAAPSCELGEACQLGNTRIAVTGATHAVDRPEAPPGFALYFVDYTIENVGTNQLDTGLLRFVLIDELGNQYSLNSAVSQLGNYPLLGGLVNAGESRQVTAGYQIPTNLSSATLRWVVSRVDNPSQVEVVIPFVGNTAGDAVVTLQQANVSEDGTSLILIGQITNAGQQPLVINQTDVSLSDGQADYFVFATSPRFPWTIGPGQPLNFTLTFQRPTSPTAVFQLLGYSFQLSGLR
ncbi:MAG: DUF4352 domain-containing protein [Anaerolineales bacterium]|nr:DUF4352 domain-containing protein [Anaerolineales bacterium]